jgi:hypothetical protein
VVNHNDSDLVVAAPAPTALAPRAAHRFTWRAVLCAAFVGAMAGYAVRPSTPAAARPREAASVSAPGAAEPVREVPRSLEAWVAEAAAANGQPPEPAAGQALVQSLVTNPSLRTEVVARYGREPAGPLRLVMREMLVQSGPAVSEAAIELVQRGDSPARAAAFELLGRLAPDPRVYELARRSVATETDPAPLGAALMALRSPSLPPQSEADVLLPRFLELSRHADPRVRAHAIQQLADWDKVGDRALPVVTAAFSDGDGLVRKAAVGAVMIGQLRSGDLQRALLAVIGNAAEDPVKGK